VVPLNLKEGESSMHLSFEVPELSAVVFKIRNNWQTRESSSETIALDIAAALSTSSPLTLKPVEAGIVLK